MNNVALFAQGARGRADSPSGVAKFKAPDLGSKTGPGSPGHHVMWSAGVADKPSKSKSATEQGEQPLAARGNAHYPPRPAGAAATSQPGRQWGAKPQQMTDAYKKRCTKAPLPTPCFEKRVELPNLTQGSVSVVLPLSPASASATALLA